MPVLKIDKFELANLVAQTALFASKDIVEKIKAGEIRASANLNWERGTVNSHASWDCYSSRRGKPNEKRGDIDEDGVKIDCNNNANFAIKNAIIKSLGLKDGRKTFMTKNDFKNYIACHIYPKPYDKRYYTSIMNLVLVPAAFAGLTDHDEYVMQVIQYRAFELFGFKPDGDPAPPKNQRIMTSYVGEKYIKTSKPF